MNNMFRGATAFNQFLLGWCVTGITTLPTDFDTDSALTPANQPSWGNCGNPISLDDNGCYN